MSKTMKRGSMISASRNLFIVASLVLACTDTSGPAGNVTKLPNSPFLVSSPVPDPSLSSSDAGTGRLSATVVYVSLPPGAIPNGTGATIRDLHSGSSATAAVVNGGFDPVALSAVVGDTLTIVVQSAGGGGSSFLSVVAGGTRATVVRTDPPPHKRDVPLNGIMVIVFSEPINPASLTPGSIQLWRQTTPVSGQLASADPGHLMATFSPDDPLAGLTDYELRVTQAVRGFDGEPLEAPVSVPFTTQAAGAGTLFTVSGTLSGLAGSGLVLLNNGGDPLTVSANGSFTFASPLASGATYSVTVFAQPASPGQVCAVTNGSGAIAAANVTNVTIACTAGPASGLVFTLVSAGDNHACGLTLSGSAYCWGENGSGQLGNGTTSGSGTPTAVSGGLRFRTLSAGGNFTCGLTASGAAFCWGSYFVYGGTTWGSLTPMEVPGGHTFATLSASVFRACGVTTVGAAYCWGDNSWGELGDGTLDPSDTPVAVVGGNTFATVGAGTFATCGVTTGAAASCWGWNIDGELGDSTDGRDARTSPVPVLGGHTFMAVNGTTWSSCGLTTGGAAYCWGNNATGNLGTGSVIGPEQCAADHGEGQVTTNACSRVPVPVIGGHSFARLSVGGARCGITTDGLTYCWGLNSSGELGDGTTVDRSTPTLVTGSAALGLTIVSAGNRLTCGLTGAGVAYCWGNNDHGELGDGTTNSSTVPVKVAGQP